MGVRRGGGGQLCGDAPVECIDAEYLRAACDRLLAGVGAAGAEQATVRGIPAWAWRRAALAAPHDGPMGAYDAGGTGKIQARNAARVRRMEAERRETGAGSGGNGGM